VEQSELAEKEMVLKGLDGEMADRPEQWVSERNLSRLDFLF